MKTVWTNRSFRYIVLIFILTLIAGSTGGCKGSGTNQQDSMDMGAIKMAALSDMPEDVQNAPVSVKEAYRFATANPDILQNIPCYCGCGSMGHTSNYACYVSGIDNQGKLSFDSHALGCSICVDITQDTIRLMKQGKSVQEIRSFVDSTYAQYGPSNIP